MNKLPILLSLLSLSSAYAEDLNITRFQHNVNTLAMPISLGDTSKLKVQVLENYVSPQVYGEEIEIKGLVPVCDNETQLHTLTFKVENRDFCKAEIKIEGLGEFEATLDGKSIGKKSMPLNPGTHEGIIKYISYPQQHDSLSVIITTDKDNCLRQVHDNTHLFVLDDVIYGKRINSATVSPDGKYLIANYSEIDKSNKNRRWQRLYDIKQGKWLHRLPENAEWMPKSYGDHTYYVIREDYANGLCLIAVDASNNEEKIVAKNLPEGEFSISPSSDYVIYLMTREGEAEGKDVYQVLNPEDRQPGWRTRYYPAIYPLKEGAMLMPLTTGSLNCVVSDISQDGKKVLLRTNKAQMGPRPTQLMTLLELDLATMQVDTIVKDDGFIADAIYSPDASQILVQGTPEAFGRIGCILPDSIIPSMIQNELFIVDVATKGVTPITKKFNPNPVDMQWSKVDGKIYLRAENRDQYTLYRLDPKTESFEEIIWPGNIVKGFDTSSDSPIVACWGQSDSSPDILTLLSKKNTVEVIDDTALDRLKDLRQAKLTDWNFVNSVGDTIYGRFYVPDDFDPNKKYPMIVNYYGGCSPSSRLYESRYPGHAYAQQGYVVYVVQPSGATGFGQEFSSRHVNTAGNGPARDIIEGTKKFIAEHDFVDSTKIGCIGASYGGFMTQYLQTLTDMFAAAVSHAGISDHTSYWGEGYWGYSYSEASMADSYPWTRRDLYVEQSPLYNADKIKTPLLFVHGDADTNVPVGESIQMFTALKLLGVPTALVLVKGQNHLILDIEKRRKWQDTINAWFAKYLKDDSSWWDNLYPDKGLNDDLNN